MRLASTRGDFHRALVFLHISFAPTRRSTTPHPSKRTVFCLAAILALDRDRRGAAVRDAAAEANGRATSAAAASVTTVPQNTDNGGTIVSGARAPRHGVPGAGGERSVRIGEETDHGRERVSRVRIEAEHLSLLRGGEAHPDARKVETTI